MLFITGGLCLRLRETRSFFRFEELELLDAYATWKLGDVEAVVTPAHGLELQLELL